jgi:hypothetical protein
VALSKFREAAVIRRRESLSYDLGLLMAKFAIQIVLERNLAETKYVTPTGGST